VGGARVENNAIDNGKVETKLIGRTGINLEVAKATNLRASWGQGYRYATIAERFVKTNFGAASVFPNPELKSETGYSTEIGVKQGFALGNWIGFADASLFWMRYKNMMEFNFGANLPVDSPNAPVLNYLGFQSRNIGSTDIKGLDISTFATNKGNLFSHTLMLGYTYIIPKQVTFDSAINANYSTTTNFLKYRFKHSIKASWDVAYKDFSFASINTLNSPMVNIDEVFEANKNPNYNPYGTIFDYGTGGVGAGLPSTIRTYRNKYNTWRLIADCRVGYKLNKQVRIAIVVKNILNTEYYVRPALIGPPRNFTLQIFSEF
jgi:iron complex outermembrane receptor protein